MPMKEESPLDSRGANVVYSESCFSLREKVFRYCIGPGEPNMLLNKAKSMFESRKRNPPLIELSETAPTRS